MKTNAGDTFTNNTMVSVFFRFVVVEVVLMEALSYLNSFQNRMNVIPFHTIAHYNRHPHTAKSTIQRLVTTKFKSCTFVQRNNVSQHITFKESL